MWKFEILCTGHLCFVWIFNYLVTELFQLWATDTLIIGLRLNSSFPPYLPFSLPTSLSPSLPPPPAPLSPSLSLPSPYSTIAREISVPDSTVWLQSLRLCLYVYFLSLQAIVGSTCTRLGVSHPAVIQGRTHLVLLRLLPPSQACALQGWWLLFSPLAQESLKNHLLCCTRAVFEADIVGHFMFGFWFTLIYRKNESGDSNDRQF